MYEMDINKRAERCIVCSSYPQQCEHELGCKLRFLGSLIWNWNFPSVNLLVLRAKQNIVFYAYFLVKVKQVIFYF